MKRFNDIQLRILEKDKLCCSDIKRIYGDYVEGDLPPSVRARLDVHIADCDECREFTAEYSEVVAIAAQLRAADEKPRVDVQNRLRQALNQRLGVNLPYIA